MASQIIAPPPVVLFPFDEATKIQNIQAAAAALLLLNVTEPELDDEEYGDKAGQILAPYIPCDTDDKRLTPDEQALCDEMMDASLELASKLKKAFAASLPN
jgi:hypothetical protein